jgi:non-ribosomal peptide synthetase component F
LTLGRTSPSTLPTPEDWNGGLIPSLCRGELLHEIFEEQADRTPDNVAVIEGARQITYRDLDERANRMAHLLRSRGIGCGSHVGILIGRSIEAYVSILACLKAGAAYVPLDPGYPADRVRFILKDCGAVLLLTASAGAGFPGDVIRINEVGDELARQPAARARKHAPRRAIYATSSTPRARRVSQRESRLNTPAPRIWCGLNNGCSACDRTTAFIRAFRWPSMPQSRKCGWHGLQELH